MTAAAALVAMVWLAGAGAARGESWCASPLIAHEWGVQVLQGEGASRPEGVSLPSWFHHSPPAASALAGGSSRPVRDLPPDSGIRALPVVQLYGPRVWGRPIPLGVEVGFAQGAASAWYPQVDRLVPEEIANSERAERGRQALLARRAARQPRGTPPSPMGADPTRQLVWEALALHHAASAEELAGLPAAEQPWVEALRQVPGALWVEQGGERERFLFYEADTREQSALVLERGERWAPGYPHYLLRNRSDWTAHDVVIIAEGRSWRAPAIPPGASAGFLLTEPLDPAELEAWLRGRWVDVVEPEPPETVRWDLASCVMMRDPALPVEAADGHRLYAAEIEILLSVWSERLVGALGGEAGAEEVRLMYREDVGALDALMPVSLYTDMYHDLRWRRLGVVVVEGLSLP